ncbi:hypothetical protein ABPG72_016322 [Tetrahymena utriculariae]
MSSQKEEQIRQKMQEKQNKMLAYLTNENKNDNQIKKQFYFMAQNHEKYPFMSDDDLALFRSSLKNIQIQNFAIFSVSAICSAAVYKICGGFTPNEKRPWLRRFRHVSVVGIPSLIIPFLYFTVIPSESQQNIVNLSLKYRAKLIDPEFNKKFIQEQIERYTKQLEKQ